MSLETREGTPTYHSTGAPTRVDRRPSVADLEDRRVRLVAILRTMATAALSAWAAFGVALALAAEAVGATA